MSVSFYRAKIRVETVEDWTEILYDFVYNHGLVERCIVEEEDKTKIHIHIEFNDRHIIGLTLEPEVGKCAWCHDRLAVTRCAKCGIPLCEECAFYRENRDYCMNCYKKVVKGARGRNNGRGAS